MENIILNDFNKLKNATDKNFSIYNYLFVILEDREISNDLFFAFLEVFWPTFIEYEGYFFLKEEFSEELFSTTNNNRKEYWINFLNLDEFFDKEDSYWKEQVIFISQKLVEIWKLKLKLDFPQIDFTVSYLHDDEYGDCGLTFYQTKFEALLDD